MSVASLRDFDAGLSDRAIVARDGLSGPVPVAPGAAENGIITLCVSGGKTLRMRADLIAEGTSWSQGAPAWQEVALYRRDTGEYAVGLKTCRGPSGESDIFRARLSVGLDDAMAWLEAFDPTSDLGVELDASDRSISGTEIALRAAALRQRTDRVSLQYRALIGELHYRLDLAE